MRVAILPRFATQVTQKKIIEGNTTATATAATITPSTQARLDRHTFTAD